MKKRRFRLNGGGRGIALAIRVITRARQDEISEVLADGTIKIRLKAPPVDGKANRALVKFLAKVLEVPQNAVEVVAGQTKRNKLVSVMDVDQATVQNRINQNVI